MPDFHFAYQRKQSPVTSYYVHRPILNVILMTLADRTIPAANLRMRLDTGANVSAVPLDFAIDVLGLSSSLNPAQIAAELRDAMAGQGLQPIKLTSASGQAHNAYPLWIPVEICDDQGVVGRFKALVAFVEGQRPTSLLAGLTGFLDKFDIELSTRQFSLHARPGSGVDCDHGTVHSTVAIS